MRFCEGFWKTCRNTLMASLARSGCFWLQLHSAVPVTQESGRKGAFVLSLDATSLWSPTGQRGYVAYRAGSVGVESVMSLTANWTSTYEGEETAFFFCIQFKFERTLMLEDIATNQKSLLHSPQREASQRSDCRYCYFLMLSCSIYFHYGKQTMQVDFRWWENCDLNY